MSEAVLAISDLSIAFANAAPRVVDGVSMSLSAKRTLAVVGESGSGKTLTALAAIGLLPGGAIVERGSITLHAKHRRDACATHTEETARDEATETELLCLTQAAWRRVRGSQIAMIFQEPMTALNPVFTVGEQLVGVIRFHRGGSERAARGAAAAALDEVGIEDSTRRLNQYPHEFSGGMRQRVMIALALAGTPRVLLADEPTTALDVSLRGQVLDLIARLKESRGLAVMLITHDLGLAARRADDVCVMYRGRVVESGPAASLLANPQHPYTRCLLKCVPTGNSRGTRLATVAEMTAS